MYTAQILNNAKSWKNKTRINKEPNFTTELLNNACNWTLLLCIEQHGGDLLNITNENSRYKGGIVEVVKGTKLNTITNFKE
jgi:hypothetical protein